MSEVNNEAKKELSKEEKIEFIKVMFSTLEIDEQAKLANFFHEEVEKGGLKYLGQKIQDVNDKMNSTIAKMYDQAMNGAKFVYNKTNDVVNSALRDEKNSSQSDNTSKGSGIWD
jgi:hypothetical protein